MKRRVSLNSKHSLIKTGMTALAAVVFLAFWLVGFDMPYEEDTDFNAPLLTDLLMGYTYLLLAAAAGVTVCSAIHGIRTRGKQGSTENGVPAARITAATWGVTAALLIVTFACASTSPIKVNGNEYAETLWLRLSDMLIFSSCVMILLATMAVAFGMSGYSRRK